MKKHILFTALLFIICEATFGSVNPSSGPNKPRISFIENKGQIHDQYYNPRPDVLFGAVSGELVLHIKKQGLSYQLCRVDKWRELPGKMRGEMIKEPVEQTIYRVDLNWLNHNADFTQAGEQAEPGYSNFYSAGNPNGVFKVKSYGSVILKNLYQGIDLKYYEKDGFLKHDYLVAAHSDYKKIKLEVKGATIRVKEDGSLLFETPLGQIQEGAPIVFQDHKQLKAKWIVLNNVLSFDIENYDPAKSLIIDPMTRIWGTYYGGGPSGSFAEHGYGCATDVAGNIYMTGTTESYGVIATSGSHQSTSGGYVEAYLVKFDQAGVRLWGTYYGGVGNEIAYSCATDVSGNVFMCGRTGTSNGGGGGNVIATFGSHQPNYAGDFDAFLVKFDANGLRQWGTYYGGAGNDQAYFCATDKNGNVCMVGITTSSTGISSPGAFDLTYTGGSIWEYDGFLVRFNANGARQWGTYYGGFDDDWIYSCATDLTGNVFITGYTESSVGIASTGAFQSQKYNQYSNHAYLAKFTPAGTRSWGTYYGGLEDSGGNSCTTDKMGNVYLAGWIEGPMFGSPQLTTPGTHQPVFGGGGADGLLVKFNTNGGRIWATYHGVGGSESIVSCVVDSLLNIFLAGIPAGSSNSMTTSNAFQTTGNGGTEAFLTKLNAVGAREWTTFYGSTGNENAECCAADNLGAVYLSGNTTSSFIMGMGTPGSHQPSYGGGSGDAYLAKFDACNTPVQPPFINANKIICDDSTQVQFTAAPVAGAFNYFWTLPSGWSGVSYNATITTIPLSSGVITVTAINNCGSSPEQTLNVKVHPLPTVTAMSSQIEICSGEPVTLTGGGAMSYTFNPGGSGSSVTVIPFATTDYTVTGIDSLGCSNSTVLRQNVEPCIGITEQDDENIIELYPNPTHGILTLNSFTTNKLEIRDLLGQNVYSGEYNSGQHQIDLTHLAKGVYMITFNSDGGTVCRKIVVE